MKASDLFENAVKKLRARQGLTALDIFDLVQALDAIARTLKYHSSHDPELLLDDLEERAKENGKRE